MNKEIKEVFINERVSKAKIPRFFLQNIFDMISKYEDIFKRDASCFSVDEIIQFYRSLHLSDVEVLKTIHANLRMYSRKCIEFGIVKENTGYGLFYTDTYISCVNPNEIKNKIITKEQLIDCLSKVQNPSDGFVLLGLFEGIKGINYSELLQTSTGDVSISGKFLNLPTGRKIKMTESLKMYIENSSKEQYYLMSDGMNFSLENSDLIVKRIVRKNMTNDEILEGRRLYQRFRNSIRKQVGLPDDINLNDIYESGKLNMLKEMIKEFNKTAEEIIYDKKLCKLIENKYSVFRNKEKYIEMYKEFL